MNYCSEPQILKAGRSRSWRHYIYRPIYIHPLYIYKYIIIIYLFIYFYTDVLYRPAVLAEFSLVFIYLSIFFFLSFQ